MKNLKKVAKLPVMGALTFSLVLSIAYVFGGNYHDSLIVGASNIRLLTHSFL